MARSASFVVGILVLMLFGGIGMVILHFFLPKPAVLELEIRDGSFDEDLLGRSVIFIDPRTGRARRETIASLGPNAGEGFGVRLDRLPSGSTDLRIELEGFRSTEIAPVLSPLTAHRLAVELESTSGLARVTVVDAKSGGAIDRALLTSPREETTAGRELRMILPAGEYRLAARASGFCDGERTLRIESGKESRIELPLSPRLTAAEAARALLDWAENPRDLDAHILIEQPSEPVSKTHVFFGSKRGSTDAGRLYAELDVDHTNSEGFETLTLSQEVRGTYRYFVHLYAGEGTLGASDATVTVATRGCKKKVYAVRTDCRGRFWSVVDIKVDDRVDIIERNECTGDPPRRWKNTKNDDR